MPAVDFFARAVESASRQNCLMGELLALVSHGVPGGMHSVPLF